MRDLTKEEIAALKSKDLYETELEFLESTKDLQESKYGWFDWYRIQCKCYLRDFATEICWFKEDREFVSEGKSWINLPSLPEPVKKRLEKKLTKYEIPIPWQGASFS